MNLFLILLLPFSIVLFIQKNGFKYITTVFIGLMAAILVCGVNAFFLTASHIIVFSFNHNFILFFVKQILLPIIIIYGLFYLISRDSIQFKTNSFFPLISSFYAFYMPFFIMKGHSVNYSFYELFTEPVLFLTMILTISILLKVITNKQQKNIKNLVIYSLCIIIYMLIPALIESIYILSINNVLVIIISAVYILLPLTAYILKKFFAVKLSFFPID